MINPIFTERLLRRTAEDALDRKDCLDRIYYRRKKSDLGFVLSHLSKLDIKEGLRAYYIGKDVAAFKQYLYQSSQLVLSTVGKTDDSIFDTFFPYACALLSDNSEVIHAMAAVKTESLHVSAVRPLYSQYLINMLQLAILGEDDQLQTKIKKVAEHGKNPARKEASEGQDFYSLLLKRDEDGLLRLIQGKHSKINSQDPWFEDLISLQAMCEIKLCWRRGMNIKVEAPLVPEDLIPIEPLTHYKDVYEFLKPDWTPPRQGLLGQVGRLIKGK